MTIYWKILTKINLVMIWLPLEENLFLSS